LNMMYSKNVIVDEIKKGFSWYLIKDDDKPIGFLSFSYFKENNCVKLHKLYVLLLYHGKGIGRQALDFVKNYAHKLNAVYVYLHVNKQNLKAIKAYQKAGFYIHHLEYNDIGNNFFMDDYVMKFDL